MRKQATGQIAEPRQTLLDALRRDAFSRSKKEGLTGKAAFEQKVNAMIAQIELHLEQDPVGIGKIGVPILTEQLALQIRDIAGAAAFRRELLKNPKAAAWLAKKMQGTKYAKYFAKIAKKAAIRAGKETKKAKRKKQMEIIAAKKKRGREIIAAIAARRRAIQIADRQWAARRKKPH